MILDNCAFDFEWVGFIKSISSKRRGIHRIQGRWKLPLKLGHGSIQQRWLKWTTWESRPKVTPLNPEFTNLAEVDQGTPAEKPAGVPTERFWVEQSVTSGEAPKKGIKRPHREIIAPNWTFAVICQEWRERWGRQRSSWLSFPWLKFWLPVIVRNNLSSSCSQEHNVLDALSCWLFSSGPVTESGHQPALRPGVLEEAWNEHVDV